MSKDKNVHPSATIFTFGKVIDFVENHPGVRGFHEGRPYGIATEIRNLGRSEAEGLRDVQKLLAEAAAEHSGAVGVKRDRKAHGEEARQGMHPERGNNAGSYV